MLRKSLAITAGTAMLAVPTTVLVAAPAHADAERAGACGGGTYELSVDREGRGWEVDADLDDVRPGSTWRIVLRHDGHRYLRVVRTADREGDVDVDTFRRNTAGSDRFTLRAKRIGTDTVCSASVRVG
jgi:hypothetical protein